MSGFPPSLQTCTYNEIIYVSGLQIIHQIATYSHLWEVLGCAVHRKNHQRTSTTMTFHSNNYALILYCETHIGI